MLPAAAAGFGKFPVSSGMAGLAGLDLHPMIRAGIAGPALMP
jgi:hypothetical protein